VHDVGVTELAERLGGEDRAHAARAVNDDRCGAVVDLVLDLALEVAARQEHRARDRALLELIQLADVEECGAAEAGLRFGGIDLDDLAFRGLQEVSETRHRYLRPEQMRS
jgi:hypothetical protein